MVKIVTLSPFRRLNSHSPRGQQYEIGWEKVIVVDLGDVADGQVLPLNGLPDALPKNLHFSMIRLIIGSMSLLQIQCKSFSHSRTIRFGWSGPESPASALTTSSTISLIALTLKINIKGTRVVYRPVGETSGICCNSAMNRKKQFEYRRNCSNRNDGIKLIILQRGRSGGGDYFNALPYSA